MAAIFGQYRDNIFGPNKITTGLFPAARAELCFRVSKVMMSNGSQTLGGSGFATPKINAAEVDVMTAAAASQQFLEEDGIYFSDWLEAQMPRAPTDAMVKRILYNMNVRDVIGFVKPKVYE